MDDGKELSVTIIQYLGTSMYRAISDSFVLNDGLDQVLTCP